MAPSNVMAAAKGLGAGVSGMVEEPISSAVPDSASEKGVPEIVIAGPPGARVLPSMM